MSNGHYRPVPPCPSDPLIIIISIPPLAVPAAGMTMHGSDVKGLPPCNLTAGTKKPQEGAREDGSKATWKEGKLIGKGNGDPKETPVFLSHVRKSYQDKKKRETKPYFPKRGCCTKSHADVVRSAACGPSRRSLAPL